MITSLLAAVLVLFGGVCGSGYLSHYDIEPTEATRQYRQDMTEIPKDLEPYQVLIAVTDCGRIGDGAILMTGGEIYTAMVFDCGAAADGGHSWMIENNIIAEVDGYNMHLAHQPATVCYRE